MIGELTGSGSVVYANFVVGSEQYRLWFRRQIRSTNRASLAHDPNLGNVRRLVHAQSNILVVRQIPPGPVRRKRIPATPTLLMRPTPTHSRADRRPGIRETVGVAPVA